MAFFSINRPMHSTHDSPPPCFKKCCTVYVKASLSRNPASFSNTGTKAYAPFFGLQWHNSLSVAGEAGEAGEAGGTLCTRCLFIHSFMISTMCIAWGNYDTSTFSGTEPQNPCTRGARRELVEQTVCQDYRGEINTWIYLFANFSR